MKRQALITPIRMHYSTRSHLNNPANRKGHNRSRRAPIQAIPNLIETSNDAWTGASLQDQLRGLKQRMVAIHEALNEVQNDLKDPISIESDVSNALPHKDDSLPGREQDGTCKLQDKSGYLQRMINQSMHTPDHIRVAH